MGKQAKLKKARQELAGLVKRVKLFDIARATAKPIRELIDSHDFVVIDATPIAEHCRAEFAKVPEGYEPYFGYWKEKLRLCLPYDQMAIEWEGDGNIQETALVLLKKQGEDDGLTTFQFKPYYLEGDPFNPFNGMDWQKVPERERLLVGMTQHVIDMGAFEEGGVETFDFNSKGELVYSSVDDDDRYPYTVVTVLMTLTFMACLNTAMTESLPSPTDDHLYKRQFGVPLTKFKTLVVKPMSKRSDTDDPQKQFDVMPLHLRRGNFATYTDEAPLFGKYAGTFWRPATVVGNEKNGVVVKDYKVQP